MFPLNTLDIIKLIKEDSYAKKSFKGVFPRDKLPNISNYPCSLIINTKPASHSGEHWFAIYYDEDKKATFFDSYGYHPKTYGMEQYLKRTSKQFCFNQDQIQGVLSSTCGYYCVYFILLMSRGFSLFEIVNEFNKKDFDFNDFKISLLIN